MRCCVRLDVLVCDSHVVDFSKAFIFCLVPFCLDSTCVVYLHSIETFVQLMNTLQKNDTEKKTSKIESTGMNGYSRSMDAFCLGKLPHQIDICLHIYSET